MKEPVAIRVDHPLGALNTLGIAATARYYCEAISTSQIAEASDFAREKNLPLLVLGGGSNIVLRGDFPGLVLHVKLRGRAVMQLPDGVRITASAGESWQSLVDFTLEQGYYGLENLTLIPGNVGAAPMQNIGAYGVELSQFVETVRGWHLDERKLMKLDNRDCEFGYRDSIFKRELQDRFIITEMTLNLPPEHSVNLSYPALAAEFGEGAEPTALEVEQTVRRIRQSKLPDPGDEPNVGSFFHNPVVSAEQFAALQREHPELPGWQQDDGRVKIPAAWLLDRAGWKGKGRGPVTMNPRQPLVLINKGGSGADVLALADDIQTDIERRFGVKLAIEPRVY